MAYFGGNKWRNGALVKEGGTDDVPASIEELRRTVEEGFASHKHSFGDKQVLLNGGGMIGMTDSGPTFDVVVKDEDGVERGVVVNGEVIVPNPGAPVVVTTVNGVESDVPAITVVQGGVQVGSLNAATGMHTVPECPPPPGPGTVTLKNNEGTALDTINVPCGATVEAVAPDGVVTIKNSGGTEAGTLNVPSGGARDALIADYAIELRDTNGTLMSRPSFPYGTTGQVTAPDSAAQPKDSAGANIGTPYVILSGETRDIPISDSTITLPNGQTKNVKATQPYTVPLTAPMKFSFSAYDQGSDLWTVTIDEAGTYNAYTQDGASGTITYSKNGGAFTALSGTIVLAISDTIQVKRTTITAAGWSRWQRLVTP